MLWLGSYVICRLRLKLGFRVMALKMQIVLIIGKDNTAVCNYENEGWDNR